MSLINSSLPSGAHVTIFFGFPDTVRLGAAEGADELGTGGGGVDVAGESLRVLAIDLSASSNGLMDDGCATL